MDEVEIAGDAVDRRVHGHWRDDDPVLKLHFAQLEWRKHGPGGLFIAGCIFPERPLGPLQPIAVAQAQVPATDVPTTGGTERPAGTPYPVVPPGQDEVLSDMLGSIGVIVAGVVLITTGWPYVDPIVGVGIGLFILPRAYRLGREALRVLLQMAPSEIDVGNVRRRLAAVPGVPSVTSSSRISFPTSMYGSVVFVFSQVRAMCGMSGRRLRRI